MRSTVEGGFVVSIVSGVVASDFMPTVNMGGFNVNSRSEEKLRKNSAIMLGAHRRWEIVRGSTNKMP